MGRHAGDYLLGTMFLAVAMLLAFTHAKSESAFPPPGEHGDFRHAFHASHWSSATERRHPATIAMKPRKPAWAVLKGLPRGTRIVVGSLDVSGGRHGLSVTVRINEPVGINESMRIKSLPVTRCSVGDIHHWRNEKSLANPMRFGVEIQTGTPVGVACEHGSIDSPARVFLTPHFVDTGTAHEPAECRFIGDSPRVRIYVDHRLVQSKNVGQIPAWSERLTSAAESRALPIVDAWVGAIRDVDHDQKLSIVVTDLDRRGRHASGSSPIHGCIRENDFRSDSDFCGDIVYIDPGIFELPTDELAALLTHETTHAAVCSIGLDDSNGAAGTAHSDHAYAGSQIPAWLNEAVAHFVELQCSGDDVRGAGVSQNFRRRMDEFFANPAGSPIVAAENVLNMEERRGGSRGAATLFLARWFSTRETLQQFVQSQTAFDCRIENLAHEPFDDVFREWTLSLATRCIPPASPASKNATSHERMSLRSDPLPAAGNQTQFSLLGTAFRCFECSEDIGSLVIESDDDAKLQISIIEPDARVTTLPHFLPESQPQTSRTTQGLSGFVSHATLQ